MTTKFLNWGNAIVLLFVLFAGFIGTMMYFMTAQKVDLVRNDYYQTELAFQKQIEKVNNTANLKSKISINYLATQQTVDITFPTNVMKGEVKFFRPSDLNLDVVHTLSNLNDPSIKLPTNKLEKGLWKVQVSWHDGTNEYFSEQEIII